MASLPSTIVGIDMGNSSWKGVRLDRKGNQYRLTRAAMVPGVFDVKNPLPPTEHSVAAKIREIGALVKASGAEVHFSLNSMNSTVRYVELPNIPVSELRTALKLNSATHLRQTFDNYTFDACALDSDPQHLEGKGLKKGAAPAGGKIKMIVGGISNPEIMIYFHASRRAGIKPKSLQVSAVSLINAFEASNPETFLSQAVVLLDYGFLSSTLTILDKGRPLLTRSVPSGAKQVTEYIAQISSCDFNKAEATKLAGDPSLSEAVTRTSVNLIREIRSSINFFEKNSDLPISRVYLTGSSIISPAVVEALSRDIGSPCEVWDSSAGLVIDLPMDQQSTFKQNPYAFATALGTARAYAAAPAPVSPAPGKPTAAASQSLTKTQIS